MLPLPAVLCTIFRWLAAVIGSKGRTYGAIGSTDHGDGTAGHHRLKEDLVYRLVNAGGSLDVCSRLRSTGRRKDLGAILAGWSYAEIGGSTPDPRDGRGHATTDITIYDGSSSTQPDGFISAVRRVPSARRNR
jgi:hypothetical protein